MSYFKLAWRNIWRNKRRTMITMASIFLAVFLALVMRSMQLGTYGRIIDNLVHSYTGYIQVHKKGYWEDKDLNNSFLLTDTLLEQVAKVHGVTAVAPRLEGFALASSGPNTKGVLVVGISPGNEEKLSGADRLVVKGRFLTPGDSGVLLAQKIASYLGLQVNDTLILIGQGFHGVSAAGKFPVRGIVHFQSPDLDKQIIYLSLTGAQNFYGAGSQATSLALNLDDRGSLSKTATLLRKELDPGKFEVMRWDDMLVEVVQHIRSDNVSGLIMLGILYLIVGFGIFGTVLMMTLERIKEFGVMVSVGMQKFRLAGVVILETIVIGMLGVIAGAVASIPPIVWFHYHPILLGGAYARSTESYGYEALLSFEMPGMYYVNNGILVLVIVLLAAIYPVRKIIRMNVIESLRHKI